MGGIKRLLHQVPKAVVSVLFLCDNLYLIAIVDYLNCFKM